MSNTSVSCKEMVILFGDTLSLPQDPVFIQKLDELMCHHIGSNDAGNWTDHFPSIKGWLASVRS